MRYDSTPVPARRENGGFLRFLTNTGKSGNSIFRSFPPFLGAIRKWPRPPILLALALSACATTAPPAEHIVTRDVPVPYYQPCPRQEDLLTVPKTVHEEHPVAPTNKVSMPKDQADVAAWISYLKGEIVAGHGRERILADKVLEQQNWIGRADRIMRACAKPSVAVQSPARAR